MRFVHCSDVHITADYFAQPLFRLGWRRWVALADHFILSGDLTAYALESEFQGARAALGELVEDRSRCTVIPGNHDVYTPGSHRSRRFERYFGHFLESDLPEHRREGAFPFVRLEEPWVQGLRFGPLAETPVKNVGQPLRYYKLL
jgi:3',5'-cyclic AMP phosphodiesterase CpdA